MMENAFSELFRKKERKKKNFIINTLKLLVTFILVNFAWIFFRANSVKEAFYVVSNLFVGLSNQLKSIDSLKQIVIDSGFSSYSLVVIIFSVFILTIYDYSFENNSIGRNNKLLNNQYSRFFAIYSLTMIILLLGNYGSAEFIYFQF